MFIEHKDVKQYKYIKNCVYRFISTNGKSYIGITNNFYKRYLDHKRNTKSQSTEKIFYNACKKYGFENFKIQILKTDIKDRELLNFIEVLYIDKYRTQDTKYGYNMTSGGDGNSLFGEANGMYGKKHSEEARQKMRENKTPNYGHTHNRNRISVYDASSNRFKIFKDDERFLSGELKIKEPKPKVYKTEEEKTENARLGQIKRHEKFANKTQEELEEINKRKALPGERNGRAKIFLIEAPSGDKYEICLDSNLKLFCDEHNLNFNALKEASNKDNIVKEPKPNNAWKNNKDYIVNRLNTIGWKITKYRRKDYEIFNR